MDDRQRGIVAAAVGAVLGGVAAYVLFTERGRHLRRELEPALEEFGHELMQLRGTVARAVGVASQGWHILDDALGDTGKGPFPTHHQSRPF